MLLLFSFRNPLSVIPTEAQGTSAKRQFFSLSVIPSVVLSEVEGGFPRSDAPFFLSVIFPSVIPTEAEGSPRSDAPSFPLSVIPTEVEGPEPALSILEGRSDALSSIHTLSLCHPERSRRAPDLLQRAPHRHHADSPPPSSMSDLPEIGTQGVVAEVPRGKCQLNARQIKEIAARFHVSPAAFLPNP